MTFDFAVPLITGFFLGGIITEVRWVLRLRQFQGQMDLNRSAEMNKATSLAVAETPDATPSSLSLHSLQDHLNVDAGATPAVEPLNVGKRDK